MIVEAREEGAFVLLISTDLISSDLISSDPSALWVVAVAENLVARCEATQFAVAVTNHSAHGSDETRSVETRSDEMR